ncbi:putative exo-beta-D-glucosaminidase [Rosellinia necatrix]|uniref:Putative exo-beta-D-glucosaminidase n=1 Tax=Rosellinia necatrix TaxID=77044 RepID=A0A1W2TPT2_ROSNE|nr:putative exo-beta-D-glucosaminidase [Rosellinia necatrix]
MRGYDLAGLLLLFLGTEAVLAASLLSKPGDSAIIPSWDIQSSAKVGNNLEALSRVGVDTSSWHHINSSRCTLMGCLLQAGVYHEEDLFYSDNLKKFDASPFHVPWIYRKEFNLDTEPDKHYFLQTHGITSKGDIFINGRQVASNKTQAGAYGGHEYDVSKVLDKQNALVVQVHPTDYNYDFALGFVDWNPYPPDNGTGVWRNIEVKQTGPVALEPLRVITETNLPKDASTARVTLKSTARNLETHEVTVNLKATVTSECGNAHSWTQTVKLGALESKELALSTTLKNPKIWWPKQWGKQPLYTGQVSASVNDEVSDIIDDTFGIRQVASKVNSHNDIIFYVNGLPFQVIGGGYSADMFLRWDDEKFTQQVQLTMDLGGNTIRLEGKNEHPELYKIADKMGLMVMAGWECCDKWEAWSYNDDLAVKSEWTEKDYVIANASMQHEALMQQNHPSMLAYVVGSDYWPNDRAAEIYATSIEKAGWKIPIVASASKRGYPEILGPSGMKMDGPYDWTAPNYWYDVEPSEERLGAAFGFGSELGAGVGTPEISSLKKFLSEADLEDLWKNPDKGLYHMSTSVSLFYDRKIYNDALWARYGAPVSLDDYLLKAQIMDYEATRSQFEAVSAFWSKERPATGLIYWMLNNAWPSLHWNLFDYYLRPAGSYFGAKVGSRVEHVAYDYFKKAIYLINHSIDKKGPRTITVDVIDKNGKSLHTSTKTVETEPNTSRNVLDLSASLKSVTDVVFLRITLADGKKATLSRNVYWLSKGLDALDWENSDWFFTPVTKYAVYTSLSKLQAADVSMTTQAAKTGEHTTVVLENHSAVPAFFITLSLIDEAGEDVVPAFWSDNYVTLWPHEKLELEVQGKGAAAVRVSGQNVKGANVSIQGI